MRWLCAASALGLVWFLSTRTTRRAPVTHFSPFLLTLFTNTLGTAPFLGLGKSSSFSSSREQPPRTISEDTRVCAHSLVCSGWLGRTHPRATNPSSAPLLLPRRWATKRPEAPCGGDAGAGACRRRVAGGEPGEQRAPLLLRWLSAASVSRQLMQRTRGLFFSAVGPGS